MVRRRYQFLLLRRIILWIAIAITIAFAMATEIGSIATFAGLITPPGIAVALQNVILAIAGYFLPHWTLRRPGGRPYPDFRRNR